MEDPDDTGPEMWRGTLTISAPSVLARMATFVPIAVAVYFFDFPTWLSSLQPSFGVFLFAGISLFIFGVAVKRRVLGASLSVSETSFPLGLLVLLISVLLYLCGSYVANEAWLHYESLVAFGSSYALFRIGKRIVREILPLLLILGFAFIPSKILGTGTANAIIPLVAAEFVLLFFVYARFRPRMTIIPAVVVTLAITLWLLRPPFITTFAVFLPILALLAPAARDLVTPNGEDTSPSCFSHFPSPNNFCSICGRMLGGVKAPDGFAAWGLGAVIFVGALMLLTNIPILSLVGNEPYQVQYTDRGTVAQAIPPAPTGWLANTTAMYNYQSEGDVFAARYVYVPAYHPETKNYTIYLEVANGRPYTVGPGGYVPGWNVVPTQFTLSQWGPFGGYLTTYSAGTRVMVAYSGGALMTFMSSTGFQAYTVQVTIVRQFAGISAVVATSQFLDEINLQWLPIFSNYAYYSQWTYFVSSMYQGATLLSAPLLAIGTSLFIGWVAYRAAHSDETKAKYVNVAYTLEEDSWLTLSKMMAEKGAKTGYELSRSTLGGGKVPDLWRLSASLARLEGEGLAGQVFKERGLELLSCWKALK